MLAGLMILLLDGFLNDCNLCLQYRLINMLGQTKKSASIRKSSKLPKLNIQTQIDNQEIADRMNQKISFTKNPRHQTQTLGYAEAFASQNVQTKFRIQPSQIFFSNYDTHHIYESQVKLINNSKCIQRVKITPLKQKEFVIAHIKYPRQESGDIAPGMHVTVSVRFRPMALSDFDDQLLIIAADGVIKVPIVAKRQRCEINWPKSISCGHCWVGDTISKEIILKNRGGEASFVLLNNTQALSAYKIGYFKVTPTAIDFQKLSQETIKIQFQPQTQGVFKQKIKFKSYQGDQDEIQIILEGGAYSAQILLQELNGQNILEQRVNNVLYINDTEIGKQAFSKIKIKNLAVVQVDYFWHFQAENIKIDLAKGKMKPSQLLEFNISIKPKDIIPEFIRLQLYLFNLPEKSLAGKVVSKNINGIQAIQCLNIDIKTRPKRSQVELSPLHRAIVQPIYQNCSVHEEITIYNHSVIRQTYKIYKIKEDKGLTAAIEESEGFIEPNTAKIVKIGFKLDQLSRDYKRACFLTSFSNSKAQIFSIQGKSTFPDLEFQDEVLYYGLCKTYTTNKKKITFFNPQKAPVQFKIHNNERFYHFEFQDFYVYENQQSYKTKFNIYESKSNQQIIDWFTIPPETQLQLQCCLTVMDPAYFQFQIGIQIKNGKTMRCGVIAQIQDVSMRMSRSEINMRDIYKGNLYNSNKFLSKELQIVNDSNHDCSFQIIDPQIDNLDIKILPLKGLIPKKSYQRIDLIIEPIQTGDFDLQLQWNYNDDYKVNSELYPDLAENIIYNSVDGKKTLTKHEEFHIKGTIKGMAMNYYIKDESRAKKIRVKLQDVSQSIKISAASMSQSMKSTKNLLENEKLVYPLLEELNFYNCEINQVKQVEIIIENDSGLTTQYEVYAEMFQTLEKKTSERKNHKGLVKVEEEAFSSEMGKTFIKNRVLDKSQKVHLGNNKGISILCEPASGTLHKKQSQRIMITMFNDTSGRFKDNLIINVKNHELKKIPMAFSIKGTPVSLSTNQLGIDFNQDTPFMNLGTILHSNGLIKKNIKVVNNGPKEVQLKWLVYRTKRLSNTNDIFKIELLQGAAGSGNIVDVRWNAIKPQIDSESCLNIEPKQKMIKGRQQINFNILIQQIKKVGEYENLLICEPTVVESGIKIAMQPLAIIVKTEAIQPLLTMDIKHKNHINKLQRFAVLHEQPETNSNNFTRKLKLKNNLKTNLTFDIAITNKDDKYQSFKIVETKTNSPATNLPSTNKQIQTSFVLTFDSILEAQIELHGNTANLSQWPLQERTRKDGQVIISYSNGDRQLIDLVGWLYRPWVKVLMPNRELHSADNFTIDFGTVHFKNSKNITFYLINPSKVDGKFTITYVKYHQSIKYKFEQTLWTALDYEDQTIQDEKKCWKLSIDGGIVRNKTIPIHYMPGTLALPSQDDKYAQTHKPIEVTIKFKPESNVLYKSKFRITIVEGLTFDIVVKGKGSYEQQLQKK